MTEKERIAFEELQVRAHKLGTDRPYLYFFVHLDEKCRKAPIVAVMGEPHCQACGRYLDTVALDILSKVSRHDEFGHFEPLPEMFPLPKQ